MPPDSGCRRRMAAGRKSARSHTRTSPSESLRIQPTWKRQLAQHAPHRFPLSHLPAGCSRRAGGGSTCRLQGQAVHGGWRTLRRASALRYQSPRPAPRPCDHAARPRGLARRLAFRRGPLASSPNQSRRECRLSGAALLNRLLEVKSNSSCADHAIVSTMLSRSRTQSQAGRRGRNPWFRRSWRARPIDRYTRLTHLFQTCSAGSLWWTLTSFQATRRK